MDAQLDNRLDIAPKTLVGLARKSVNQISVEHEPGIEQQTGTRLHHRSRVSTFDGAENPVVEALHAHADAPHAATDENGYVLRGERLGRGFDRVHMSAMRRGLGKDGDQDACEQIWGQGGWRAPAHVELCEARTRPDPFELADQRVDIATLLLAVRTDLGRIEAERAVIAAERDVDINSQI